MSVVTINIPRTTRAAKVGLLDEFSTKEFTGNSEDMKVFIREQKNKKRTAALFAQRKKELAKKVIFTEKFVISNSNQPLQISLKNIGEPTLSISEAKYEIQNAYDKGFSDGQEAASIAYQNEVEKYTHWIAEFDELSKKLRTEYSLNMHKLENAVVPVAVMIAKHILMREISNDSNIVIEQVRKAIKLTDEDSVVKIIVNPEDLEILNSVKSTLTSDKSVSENIEITSDSKISRGGCMLLTNVGIIDACIESQLQKIQENLSEI